MQPAFFFSQENSEDLSEMSSTDLPVFPRQWKEDCQKLLRFAGFFFKKEVKGDVWVSCSVLSMWNQVGWVRRRCPVAFVTGAPNWYWLTVGQGLLSLQQVRVEEECCNFFYSFTFFHFLSLLYPSLSSPLVSLLSLFSLSLGDDTKWPTRIDMSLNMASVAQLDAPSDWRSGGRGFNPGRGRQLPIVEIWSWNIFYGHSLPSADSRRAVVSLWRKNVHNTG